MRTEAGRTTDNRSALAALHRRARQEERAGASLSGHERNRLFWSRDGEQFLDVSGVSGLDDPADGRAFATLDYDRDGWLDVALVNSNAPRFELFRNQSGCHPAVGPERGRFVAIRFVGGNHAPESSSTWSARDGIGAAVTVELRDRRLLREVRAGEGLAAQNSATLFVGIGDEESAESVTVRWPSGKRQSVNDVASGTLLTVYEDDRRSPGGGAFVRERYGRAAPSPPLSTRRSALDLAALEGRKDGARLHLFTTMATWCAACVAELPKLTRLRALFGPEELSMYGVPIDAAETRDQVLAWSEDRELPYELRADASADVVARVRELVLDALQVDAVPATLLTDASGSVLRIQWGPPSVSVIRALLAKTSADVATCEPGEMP